MSARADAAGAGDGGARGATVRAYVPATALALARALRSGWVDAATAHAVTPALREWYAGGDSEELELAATTDAAQVSLTRVVEERRTPAEPARGDPSAGGPLAGLARRVVIAVDAPVVGPTGPVSDPVGTGVIGERPTGRSLVHLAGGGVPWAAVVSVHVDEADAVADVAAAALSLEAATAGDEDALHAIEDAEARDLLWYDATEADALLAELSATARG